MKTVMNHSQDGGLLKMIRRTDPVILLRYYFAHSQESLGNLDWYNKHRNNCDRVACWEGFCVPLRIE